MRSHMFFSRTRPASTLYRGEGGGTLNRVRWSVSDLQMKTVNVLFDAALLYVLKG